LHIIQYNFPFLQICEDHSKYTVRWDEQQKVPFACFKNQWVGYDDVKSVTYKVRNIQRNQFIWALVKTIMHNRPSSSLSAWGDWRLFMAVLNLRGTTGWPISV
jgi:hypothetical protein